MNASESFENLKTCFLSDCKHSKYGHHKREGLQLVKL